MRIIAGEHRGRPLAAPAGQKVRPTSDRTRQALFNLLEHGRLASSGSLIASAVVLDAFAGTGALALEALSRGAASATLIEKDRAALAVARANAESLGVAVRLLQADATRPPPASEPASLVFLDPPYASGLAEQALTALLENGWIAPGAVIAVETGSKDRLTPPDGFRLEDARNYGRARIWLLTRA